MYQGRQSIYICMMLDPGKQPMAAEVIQAASLAEAIDRAEELLGCTRFPAAPQGYELWNRGRKLVTWQHQMAAA